MKAAVKKAVSDFYGSKIKTGALHDKMGVSQDKKIPENKIDKKLSGIKDKKAKSPAEVKEERELVFAKNAKKFKHS